jgi:hypothetical protein
LLGWLNQLWRVVGRFVDGFGYRISSDVIGDAEPGGRTRKVLLKKGQDPFKDQLEKRAKYRS